MIPIADEEKKVTEEKEELSPENTEAEAAEETAEETPEETPAKEKKAKKKKEKGPSKDEEIAALNDKYLRLYAEYDNFRRRSQKEKSDIYAEVKANAVADFLPVYDNLVRALAAPTEDEAYRKGVEMIMTQFGHTLEKLGVTQIPALGEKFNPELHNAVMHCDDEEKGENEIVEVFQEGFKLGDKTIRASMVKVAN